MNNVKIAGIFLAGFIVGGALWYVAAQQGWFATQERTFNANESTEQTGAQDPQQPEQESVDADEQTRTARTAEEDDGALIGDELPPESSTRVSVSAQPAGERVVVDELAMPEPGWVVVHEMRDGHIANALGAGRVREAGEYTDFEVPLLRATGAGETYIVVLYSDNDNGEFDINVDLPIVDAFGEAMVAEFEAREQ